jgi:hypothetical protein
MPLILFIATLPLVLALGHDLYLFYMNQDKGFDFATLGWIWATYHEDSLKATADVIVANFGEETWKAVAPVLTYQAALAGIIFAALFYIPYGALKLLDVTSPRKSKSSSDRLLERHKSKKKMKYGRR